MPNRAGLTGNLPLMMHAFGANTFTHNIKTEQVLLRKDAYFREMHMQTTLFVPPIV